jgi:hypothetical protein
VRTDSAEAIALAEVADARARLSVTLRALEWRIGPHQLEKDAVAGLKSLLKRGRQRAGRTVRAHSVFFGACGVIIGLSAIAGLVVRAQSLRRD